MQKCLQKIDFSMPTTSFGFAIASSMIPSGSALHKEGFNPYTGKQEIESAQSVVNPAHAATIRALKDKFGLNVVIPKEAASITLQPGDSIIVAEHNLPRLLENRHYSQEEVDKADIKFYKYTLR